MSNPLVIAAVTTTLRHLLEQGLNVAVPGIKVTTRPPDKARDNTSGNQINLFLYLVLPNAAWRNIEPTQPPLALKLYYLLSVYGQNDDDPDPFSHRLLGQAMQTLHEQPILDPLAIRETLGENDLHEPTQRVSISLQPLTLEEMAKLWTLLQTPYRLSIVYEVSVVLISPPAAPRAEGHAVQP